MKKFREIASYDWTPDSIRIMATPSAFAKSSLYYIQEAGHFRTLPNYFTERENLDSYLIVYTLAGKGSLTYGGKTYAVLPNQLFYIDCRNHQYYRTDPSDPWELLWIHFYGSASKAYYDRFASVSPPVITLPSGNGVPGHIRELIGLHRNKTIQTELLASRRIVDVLTELLLLRAASRDDAGPAVPDFIRDVMKHYDRHYPDKLPLERVAARFSTDKYHLAKAFKRYTGLSPNEYLINARITRAKELLRFTDIPVSEIAAEVGIENVSHFINLFRDREGSTPLVYRKHWRES